MLSPSDRKTVSIPSNSSNVLNKLVKIANERHDIECEMQGISHTNIRQWQLASALILLAEQDSAVLDAAVKFHYESDAMPSLSKKVKNLSPDKRARLEAMIESGEL